MSKSANAEQLFRRLILVVVGFAAACFFAASFALLSAAAVAIYENQSSKSAIDNLAGLALIPLILPTAVIISSIGAIPVGIPAVLAGEFFAVRRWWFYTAAGGLGPNFPAIVRSISMGRPPEISSDQVWFCLAGMVGGYVYWLIAGRSAGGPRPLVITTNT